MHQFKRDTSHLDINGKFTIGKVSHRCICDVRYFNGIDGMNIVIALIVTQCKDIIYISTGLLISEFPV